MLLYVLTVGPVRGFAFFLALATALDVVVAWFFIRPMVALLGRSKLFTEARWWGVARGLGAAQTDRSAPSWEVGREHADRSERRTAQLWQRLYHGETTYDFVGQLKKWTIISLVVIAVGLVSLGQPRAEPRHRLRGRGRVGGAAGDVSVADAQEAMDDEGLKGVDRPDPHRGGREPPAGRVRVGARR